ncbi:MAG: VOC family protein, partial [Actinomycetota bacterium]|nr:VOC family protein [Actinomycetota bacterium]
LEGQRFTAINGGPEFPFTEAVSLLVNCESQEEVDYFWERLASDGGEEGPCGWLKDRYGLSWQVVPTELEKMLNDPDQEKGQRAMEAMLGMKKLVIAELRRAYEAE